MRPAGAAPTSDRKSNKATKVTEKVTDVTEIRIIELLKDNSKYKTTELAEMLDISRKTVFIKLKNLREKGIIERVGSDRKGYWNMEYLSVTLRPLIKYSQRIERYTHYMRWNKTEKSVLFVCYM